MGSPVMHCSATGPGAPAGAAVLEGKSGGSGIRRSATLRGMSAGERQRVEACAD
jgi:hypothetical protein